MTRPRAENSAKAPKGANVRATSGVKKAKSAGGRHGESPQQRAQRLRSIVRRA